MKIFSEDARGNRTLAGYAEIADDCKDYYTVNLFGAIDTKVIEFLIDTIEVEDKNNDKRLSERVLIVADSQVPDVLPGWKPLSFLRS